MAKPTRQERLEAQLRENLKRRREQARARRAGEHGTETPARDASASQDGTPADATDAGKPPAPTER